MSAFDPLRTVGELGLALGCRMLQGDARCPAGLENPFQMSHSIIAI
jgi:hypothetical protein